MHSRSRKCSDHRRHEHQESGSETERDSLPKGMELKNSGECRACPEDVVETECIAYTNSLEPIAATGPSFQFASAPRSGKPQIGERAARRTYRGGVCGAGRAWLFRVCWLGSPYALAACRSRPTLRNRRLLAITVLMVKSQSIVRIAKTNAGDTLKTPGLAERCFGVWRSTMDSPGAPPELRARAASHINHECIRSECRLPAEAVC